MGVFLCLGMAYPSLSQGLLDEDDSTKTKDYKPSFRPKLNYTDRLGDPFSNPPSRSPLYLEDPSNIKTKVEVDSQSRTYTIYEQVGSLDYRPVSTMTFEQYDKYMEKKLQKGYMKAKAEGQDGESPTTGRSLIPKIYLSPMFDRIFGGNYIDIRPNGSVMLDFGGQYQKIANPNVPIRQQSFGNFQFDQQINVSVQGKIGEKLKMNINYDTKAAFDFDNQIKLDYSGKDHEIIQRLEAGNVSMPLSSTLITGAQNLFGVKTTMQFGKLKVTAVASNQRGKANRLKLKGGVSQREFIVPCNQYEANKHFFLSQAFRNSYERSLKTIPLVTSGLNVTRVEVYVTNRAGNTQSLRNVLPLIDLGEANPFKPTWKKSGVRLNEPPDNKNNRLYASILGKGQSILGGDNTKAELEAFNLTRSSDYEFLKGARKLLMGRDFKVQAQLGYISLNFALRDDEVLGVAYEYTYNGAIHKVGELQEDYSVRTESDLVVLKLLRPAVINTKLPTWDLQMKNIYNLGTSQIGANNFQLRVIYRDDATGVDNPSMPTGSGINLQDKPLVQVFNLDRLNPGNELQPDGNFDFVEDVTIDSKNGRIIFPVLEPFGATLEKQFVLPGEIQQSDKYVFKDLYQLTQADALQAANKAKFFIKGRMEGASSSEISLPGVNIAPGSVKLYSGSTLLTPETDYTIDYPLGRLKILNTGLLTSGTDLEVEFEQADLFSFQQRSFFGTRFDYVYSKNINFGSTFLYLNERPIIRRVQVGNEPSRNVMIGLDANYKSDSRLLTKIVDAIPLIQTKETSTITASAEYAHLIPGTNKFVDPTGKGISYLDDFEGVRTPYSMGGQSTRWKLPSVPAGFEGEGYRLSDPSNWRKLNYRRAKTAWYIIDNLFYRTSGGVKPANIGPEDVKLHYARAVGPQEVQRGKDLNAINLNETVFDIAYYPEERGQYNYNPDLTQEGKLKNPRQNWGGVMRSINTDTDFDAANVEYVEFWMMDPFISGPLGAIGGKEYQPGNRDGIVTLDLGNISEDVLRDSKLSFEQGLPTRGGDNEVDRTPFGKVGRGQIIQYAFENDVTSRPFQDVGLDGLNNIEERDRFKFVDTVKTIPGILPEVVAKIEEDPSADDFRYFLDSRYNDEDAKILERYKNFNNLESNSPTGGNADFTPSYTNQPDMEDINQDNTLSDLDAYYSYNIRFRESEMEVGKNYIIDKIAGTGYNWYLFRIPIKDKTHPNFGGVTGNITDFKTIRFMRLRMTGMTDPVVLRLVQFQYVGSQWRPFPKKLTNDGVFTDNEDKGALRIGTVNIEENGNEVTGQKTPYVTPPGAQQRDRDITSGVNRRLNEQSLQLCADNLADGDAKAAFKNVTFDFLNYKRLQMFVHAETPLNSNTSDGETQLFVRLGTDFNENFYEVSIPLKLTPLGTSYSTPDLIWPQVNALNLAFEDLIKAKLERNSAGVNFQSRYKYSVPIMNGDQRSDIFLVGNPDLNAVVTVMIGIRNPSNIAGNDGFAKSVCLWLNELRVTDYDKNAGWATTGRVNLKLADFAVVNMSGKYSTPGFGSIEQRISERSRETFSTFNITSNVVMDKFLPKKLGLKIPMFVSYENTTITPKFDPLNPDVKVDQIKQTGKYESYKQFIQDKTEKNAINFTNVSKVKTGTSTKSHLWDIENLNFTFSRAEITRSNVNIQSYKSVNTVYSAGYNFSSSATPIEPFKKVKFLNSKYLKLIKELNFSYLPSNITVRGDLNRTFTRTQLRGSDVFSPFLPPGLLNFEKSFFFNRNYAVRYSPFKSLTFDYTANVSALIDEPIGEIDNTELRPGFTKKDSVNKNLRKLGRMKKFDQNIRMGYRLPLDKFPLFDWTSADAAYAATYLWTAAPLGLSDDSSRLLGNRVENSRELSINGRFDFVKLYNKVKWLNDINNPKPKPKKSAKVDPKAKDKKAAPVKKPIKKTKALLAKEKKIAQLKEAAEKAKADSLKKAGIKVVKTPEKDKAKTDTAKKKPPELKLLKALVRAVMSVRNVNFSLTQTENTVLPGFTQTIDYLGRNTSTSAPGWPFILGDQDPNIRVKAAANGWLSTSPDQNQLFTQSKTVNLTARATIEPFKDFRIQLDLKRSETDTYNENFRTDVDSTGILIFGADGKPIYVSQTPNRLGTYSISMIAINTAFTENDPNNRNRSPEFNTFQSNRDIIQERLVATGVVKPDPDKVGELDSLYKKDGQSILIPSFIAAYTGVSAKSASLTSFPAIPLPNWRLDYGGLTKLPALADKFSSINLTHGYTCTYTVDQYSSSLNYGGDKLLLSRTRDIVPTEKSETGVLLPAYNINQVTLVERFSPLIGVNVRTKSKITLKFDYNKDRTVMLNTSNASITEQRAKEFTFGAGYQKSGMKLPFKIQGQQVVLKNEVTLRCDVSYRSTTNIQRFFNQAHAYQSGSIAELQIRPTLSYVFNQRLNLQAYFSYVSTSPFTSNSFPTKTTRFGIQLRFNLN